MRIYPFPNPDTKICASIGYPNKKTKSPFMHNAGFTYLDLNFIYHGWEVEDIGIAIDAMKAFNFCGYSVSMPFKEEIIQYVDFLDEAVSVIHACNTVYNDHGILKGFNSDWVGAITTLKQRINLQGKQAVILGAGGTARAITYGLKQQQAEVLVLNRNISRAEKLAKDFNVAYGDINDTKNYKAYDILINATPVGTKEQENCDCRLCHFLGVSTFPDRFHDADTNTMFLEDRIALDVVFQKNETTFTKKAQERNFNVIHGHEMLVEQGAFQFELFTGTKAPKDVMYAALKKTLE